MGGMRASPIGVALEALEETGDSFKDFVYLLRDAHLSRRSRRLCKVGIR